MSTYAIGDVQGCFNALQQLLEEIKFDAKNDELWLVGDLVNRGPDSLKVLRFVKQLPRVKVVLGNHDLHLLALAYGNPYPHHTLQAILEASDRDELIAWLRQQKILHYDDTLNYVMVHAGIYPFWNLQQAQHYAKELEYALQNQQVGQLLQHMYGDQPDKWQDNLQGWERLRFITNAFTRMRFCSLDGRLEFDAVGTLDSQPQGFLPWFEIPERKTQQVKIIFGHWAALQGKINTPNCFGLDTGCVWGNSLTAIRLEDQKLFSVKCKEA